MSRPRETRIVSGTTEYRCCRCFGWFQSGGYYADKRRRAGIKSECKTCHCRTTITTRDPDRHREFNRKWMADSHYGQRPAVTERERTRSKRRRSEEPLETWCRAATHAAIAKGLIVKPAACRCGRADIQGHHTDYTRPLLIEWMCAQCHANAHRALTFKRVAQ